MPVFQGIMSFSFEVMDWLSVELYVIGTWGNVDIYFCG